MITADLNNLELFDLFKDDLDKFLKYFRYNLFERLKFDPIINEFLKNQSSKFYEIHIIIDPIKYEFTTHELGRFSDNWSKYISKLVKIKACYMTLGLDKEPYYKSITYFCDEHLKEVEKTVGKLE